MKPNLHLKYERERRGWSQARVADEIGTTEKNVGRWERGVSYPYPFFREKLCLLFGKNAQELGFVKDILPQNDSQ
ncbi:MAG: helix-turn-helix transcriptional regulator, partial [Ktedonobacteraceae bacterium]|nr:helix-turn-helix transcriptional regulator [Ktedonobacteraceae bacterium]